ncbi:hypothetical protein [Streptomyces sp. XD-27]|uniref:hypothetical protein n=1 Tax=Streptomyces sp. XD-27 TaxID=3062779 RepID=UPI0026F41D23|nr:hypothetical protein [Streptomyces sp. XD-27]WKX70369.1 hypothetical protein Q3Y56_10965 [Streptomyces sp. XD-27]
MTSREESLTPWENKPSWKLTYTSPDKGPQYEQGNQQKVAAMVFMDLRVDSPNATPYSKVGTYRSLVRFDYAGPVAGKYLGTVFTEARVTLTLGPVYVAIVR